MSKEVQFENRIDAGKQLAEILTEYKGTNALLLGLPRGGVVVAWPISQELNLPLNAVLAVKIGHPNDSEFAIGAISEFGVKILTAFESKEVIQVEAKRLKEIDRQKNIFRDNQDLPNMEGRIAILVDDGIATGLTLQAAILAVKKLNPEFIVAAVPFSTDNAAETITLMVDDFKCVLVSPDIKSVGEAYQEFGQVHDLDVIRYLHAGR